MRRKFPSFLNENLGCRKRERLPSRRARLPKHAICANHRAIVPIRTLLLGLSLSLVVVPVAAAESLGIFDGWGAFRDSAKVSRCYAIARADGQRGKAEPAYASIGYWPGSRIRGQFYARLGRAAAPGRDIVIGIGAARFALVGEGRNAWARDARTDAAIIAAIRSASTMTIRTSDTRGNRFSDRYALKGAATAIDAAALGCARAR